MKIKLYAGLPGGPNPFLPEGGDGTSGGTNGGAGAPPAAPPAPTTPPAAGAPAAGPNGFPEGVPLEQMQPEQREAYWKHWAKTNRSQLEATQAELAAAKPLAEQYAALEAASKTQHQLDIEAARTEAAAATRAEVEAAVRDRYAPALVQARLESALAGRMDAKQVGALMPTLNVPALLGTDGLPDGDKIAAFVSALPAPAAAQTAGPPADLGGGRRTPVTTGGTQAGAALYAERHKRPAG